MSDAGPGTLGSAAACTRESEGPVIQRCPVWPGRLQRPSSAQGPRSGCARACDLRGSRAVRRVRARIQSAEENHE